MCVHRPARVERPALDEALSDAVRRCELRRREPGQARIRSEAGSQQAEASDQGARQQAKQREFKREKPSEQTKSEAKLGSQGVKLSKPRRGEVPKAKRKSVGK